jgi:hypothetical protein
MTGLAVPQSARLRCNTKQGPSYPPCINEGSRDPALSDSGGVLVITSASWRVPQGPGQRAFISQVWLCAF